MTNNSNYGIYKFLTELQKTISEFNIKFKNDSEFMKTLSYILFFNKKFMTGYTTTIGSTVYFPSKTDLERNLNSSQIVLAHEFVHAIDKKNNKFFQILYLFPQILSPIFLILFFIFNYNLILLSLTIIFISPIIPAFWRSKDELRGYQMSMFVLSEQMKESNVSENFYDLTLNNYIKSINQHFTGSEYYWMNILGVQSKLVETFNKIKNDDMMKDDPVYSIVREAIINSRKDI